MDFYYSFGLSRSMLRSDRTTSLDVDYKILGTKGLKVPPKPENRNMADKNLERDAIYAQSDLEDFFDTFDITTLGEEDEIGLYITELGDLKRKFRRVFSELKVEI